MKKLFLLISVATVTGCILTICPAPPVLATADVPPGSFDPRAAYPDGGSANPMLHPAGVADASCAHPAPDQAQECRRLEQQILASTVRIEWNLWVKDDKDGEYSRVDRISHATVKQGRYLVTHNHSQVLSSDMKNQEFNRISISTADGALIWPKGPLNTITVIVEDEETLVLDFGDYGGQGLFTLLGVPSAQFSAWESLPLKPGMEVAQVICEGEIAHVDWVTIEDVMTGIGTPRLELGSLVTLGTSGGGVFWKGYHIANTWYQATAYADDRAAVPRQYSVAALNSPRIAAQLANVPQ